MAGYELYLHEETGVVTLRIEKAVDLKPLMEWKSLDSMRAFAEMLLDFYWERKMHDLKIEDIAEVIVRQALGEDE
ncbi:MAG: hypothetical protein R6U37_02985 [Dehalococcoidia bacterium]